MDAQELRNLQEAYMKVVENQYLDEVSGGGYIPPGGTQYGRNWPRDNRSAAQIRRDNFLNNFSSGSGGREGLEKAQKDANIRSRTSRSSAEQVPNRDGSGILGTGGRSPGGTESGLSMSPARRMEGRAKSLAAKGLTKPANKILSILDRLKRGSSSLPNLGSSGGSELSPAGLGKFTPGSGRKFGISGIGLADEYNLYDLVLLHLLDEGYAETVEAAEAIMVNMSEEWRQSIIG